MFKLCISCISSGGDMYRHEIYKISSISSVAMHFIITRFSIMNKDQLFCESLFKYSPVFCLSNNLEGRDPDEHRICPHFYIYLACIIKTWDGHMTGSDVIKGVGSVSTEGAATPVQVRH